MKSSSPLGLLFAILLLGFFHCRKEKVDLCLTSDLEVSIRVSADTTTLFANASGGLPPYSYKWQNSNSSDSIYSGTRLNGYYYIDVTDFSGCKKTGVIYIFGSVIPCDNFGSVKAQDSSEYGIIVIGTQCWLFPDLEVKLPEVKYYPDNFNWSLIKDEPGFCYAYDDKGSKITTLYNGNAVKTGKLCPNGWHIPSLGEWQTLIDYLGGDAIAGGKLKSNSLHWKSPNTLDSIAPSLFSAEPGGRRQTDGASIYAGEIAHFWTSTKAADTNTYYGILMVNAGTNIFTGLQWHVKNGLQCRCIRDK
jgi:uncharacterized protein (TIGR02145 family)